MRSGLPEYADSIAKQFPASAHRTWTADELLELAMESGAVTPAGAATSVSVNTNYVILGELAQAVTGTPIDELVRQRLLKPLRLTHTVYPTADRVELPTPFTRGYVTPSGSEALKGVGSSVAAGTDVTDWNPSWSNAGGMMSSTLEDLGRWGNGLLGNALLAAGLQQARLQTVPQTPQWTYGFGIVALPGGHWIGHGGGIPGWSTWVLHNLRTGMTVVTSINSCCGEVPASFTLLLLKTLYPATFVGRRPEGDHAVQALAHDVLHAGTRVGDGPVGDAGSLGRDGEQGRDEDEAHRRLPAPGRAVARDVRRAVPERRAILAADACDQGEAVHDRERQPRLHLGVGRADARDANMARHERDADRPAGRVRRPNVRDGGRCRALRDGQVDHDVLSTGPEGGDRQALRQVEKQGRRAASRS